MTDEDFAHLYEALRNSVYSYAAKRVGPEAAKDVVADTFEVAWQKRQGFPVDRSEWTKWVVGIAKNKVLQELQRRQRKHHDNRFVVDWTDDERDRSEADIAATVVANDTARRIYEALSPAEKRLFDLAFMRDLSPDEAATILDISTTAFTTRLSRLRRKLIALEAELQPVPERTGRR